MKQILVDDATYETAEKLALLQHMDLGEYVKELLGAQLSPAPKASDIIGFFEDSPEMMDEIVAEAIADRRKPFRSND